MNYGVVAITGGTGSLGKEVLRHLISPQTKEIRVFSRSERTQYFLRSQFEHPNLKWILGDIRNLYSLQKAFSGVDLVIHTAAMKQVPLCETNVLECIETNVIGTQLVAQACHLERVKKLVALSTDKAANPQSVYGYSKLLGERLIVEASNGNLETVAVRFGNLLGSDGSVIDLFIRQALADKTLTVTDPCMTRFFVPIKDAAAIVLALAEPGRSGVAAYGGFKSSLLGLVDGFRSAWKDLCGEELGLKTIPVRPGERQHEEILNDREEAARAWQEDIDGMMVWRLGGAPTGNLPNTDNFKSSTGDKVDPAWFAELLKPLIAARLR